MTGCSCFNFCNDSSSTDGAPLAVFFTGLRASPPSRFLLNKSACLCGLESGLNPTNACSLMPRMISRNLPSSSLPRCFNARLSTRMPLSSISMRTRTTSTSNMNAFSNSSLAVIARNMRVYSAHVQRASRCT